MIGVITGDLVNSRGVTPERWMPILKEVLNSFGPEYTVWEIYRGDSFQFIVSPQNALASAIQLKATMNQLKQLDVRMAIGIGYAEYQAPQISHSNGSAFIHSGECFDELKKETLAIKTPWSQFDRTLNLMLSLAGLTMDSWTPASARIMAEMMRYPDLNQAEIAEQLERKSQGTISEGLKRGGYEEIQKLLLYYKEEITKLCSS